MTKLCVKELGVTKLCVKGLSDKLCVKGICDKVVWKSFVCHQSQPSAISATPATQSEGRCPPSAMPATQSQPRRMSPAPKRATRASPRRPPSATPATQSEGRCRQVPRLPCKVKVDVAKCAVSCVHAKFEGRCRQVPRLPRKDKLRPPRPKLCA